ncbi:MAG: DUF1573 domain-containing protein [Patescibacteria group bacterium]
MKKQTKNVILGLAALIILLIGFNAISSPSVSETDSAVEASLTVSEMNWDFGDVMMSKGVTTYEVKLTNDSETPIKITEMETSCMCTTAQIVHTDGSKSGLKGMAGHGGGTATLSETISAGETATLLVSFDPNAHGPDATGAITRNIILKTNSQTEPEIKLTFSANVIK